MIDRVFQSLFDRSISKPKGVSGFDNIPDLTVEYSCSNAGCSDRDEKWLEIYVARWIAYDETRHEMPVITDIISSGNHRYHFPPDCHEISPRVRRCCWNCGKKNRNSKPSTLSSFNREDLRRRVAVEEEKARAKLLERTIAFNEELKRLGILREARQEIKPQTASKSNRLRAFVIRADRSIDVSIDRSIDHLVPMSLFRQFSSTKTKYELM